MKKAFSAQLMKKAIAIVSVASVLSSQAFANSTTPSFFTNINKAFLAGAGWLGTIVAASTGFYVAFHAWQKSMTDDEAVIAQKNKLIKNALVGAAIVLGGGSVVTAVLAFF